MSDLVKRLRADSSNISIAIAAREAADEIERLRQKFRGAMIEQHILDGEIDGEIERLRAVLKNIAEFCSCDSTVLGATGRLASIRNTAERALAGEQKTETKL